MRNFRALYKLTRGSLRSTASLSAEPYFRRPDRLFGRLHISVGPEFQGHTEKRSPAVTAARTQGHPRQRQTPGSCCQPQPAAPVPLPATHLPQRRSRFSDSSIERAKFGRHEEARAGRGHARGEHLSPVPSPRPPEETPTPRQTSAPSARRRALSPPSAPAPGGMRPRHPEHTGPGPAPRGGAIRAALKHHTEL